MGILTSTVTILSLLAKGMVVVTGLKPVHGDVTVIVSLLFPIVVVVGKLEVIEVVIVVLAIDSTQVRQVWEEEIPEENVGAKEDEVLEEDSTVCVVVVGLCTTNVTTLSLFPYGMVEVVM